MYPPSCSSYRKRFSGLEFPAASRSTSSPDSEPSFLTSRRAVRSMSDDEMLFPSASRSWSLIGIVRPALNALLRSVSELTS